MWPGNTADVTTLTPVIDGLRNRFAIRRVCIVADRGMIGAETLAELETRDLLYMLGVRERTDKIVRELVLDDPAPFVPLEIDNCGKQVDYEAKSVSLAGRHYIVWRNHQEAQKDATDRAAIVAVLQRQLAKGDKALIGNNRLPPLPQDDQQRPFCHRSNQGRGRRKVRCHVCAADHLNPLEAMLCCKQLWTGEQTFRTAKHLLTTRPIFHKLDVTIRGHAVCSFLALVLKRALEDRIATLNRVASWTDIIADLNAPTETEIEQDGKRFIVRCTAPRSQPCHPRNPRGATTNCPPSHQRLIKSSSENVVPRRRLGTNCRCPSNTSQNQRVKQGRPWPWPAMARRAIAADALIRSCEIAPCPATPLPSGLSSLAQPDAAGQEQFVLARGSRSRKSDGPRAVLAGHVACQILWVTGAS